MMDESIEKNFGIILRKLRNERNISQEKLAELSDLDRTYISLFERGLRQSTLSTLLRISKALELSFSKLAQIVEERYEN